jgi:hypothetical protein
MKTIKQTSHKPFTLAVAEQLEAGHYGTYQVAIREWDGDMTAIIKDGPDITIIQQELNRKVKKMYLNNYEARALVTLANNPTYK